jgi:E-phenylitaconyl-CoA hydratase
MTQLADVDLSGELPGLTYSKSEHIAVLTLNRPHVGNSLTRAMRPVVRAIWDDVRTDDDIRVLIITGAGNRHFCTGLDLADAQASGGTSTTGGPLAEEMVWSPMHFGIWKPIIVALNGLVTGSGLHIVGDADIVVAEEHVSVMDTHTTVGMVGGVENVALARRLPLGSVLRITFQGKYYRMPASRAYALGLIDELVPTGQALDTSMDIARDICRNSPTAISLSKQAIWAAGSAGQLEAQELGWALARMHWSHPDFAEGPRAFVEKRDPVWQQTGRQT